MRLAIDEAALGDYSLDAVITREGNVLARGRNLGKQERDPTAHARRWWRSAAFSPSIDLRR
ncbi:MAG: hypothetical protein ACREDO_10955 [Methyloceanibacter sp.]